MQYTPKVSNSKMLIYLTQLRFVGRPLRSGRISGVCVAVRYRGECGIYVINEYNACKMISSQRGTRLYLRAFNHKITPILLTIISTILGLIPFLYDGPEEVFWFAFAIAAISGTAFSIIALLVYMPIFMPLGKTSKKRQISTH